MRGALLAVLALVVASAAPVSASAVESARAGPTVPAAAWYLVGDDGAVLARQSALEQRAIASITKLMTAIVVLEHARLGDVVRVSPQAAALGEATVELRPGEQLTVKELLQGMLVPSANDAAEALALHVGKGSVDRFVQLMNAKARELALADTHFENPHGLDQPGHVSSARDATVLVRYALGVPFLRETLGRSTVSLPGRDTFETTDDVLRSWAPLVGGKTGHTGAAGWSEAGAAERGGVTVYGTVLGSDSRSARNRALRELLTYGLRQYRRVRLIEADRVYAEPVTGYGGPDVQLVARDQLARPVRIGASLVERVIAPVAVAPPIRKGQELGRVEVWDGNRLVASSRLVASKAVSEPGVVSKALWYVERTADNLWGIVT